MGIKNIQGELRVNDEVVATQDWVNKQSIAPIIATFNTIKKNETITLNNFKGAFSIDWGDGTVNNELNHTYVDVGEYICKIYNVTSIGERAFYGCDRLTEIIIPNSVISIGEHAFSKCNSLIDVVIPDSVTNIKSMAFYDCADLASVVIGNNATNIGGYIFYYCDNLTSVEFKNPIPIAYKSQNLWFAYCPALAHIYVPYGCKQAYIDKWTADGATQDILDKIVESDREAMMRDVNALKTEIQEQLVSKTDYLGTVTDVPNFPDAGAGDSCRVSAEFTYNIADGEVAHIGDILIAIKDNPTQSKDDWDLLHNELTSATLVTVGGAAQTSWDANTKLDKVTSASSLQQAYIKNMNGTQSMANMSSSTVGSSLVQRQANSHILVPVTPVVDGDATSKKYVDDGFVAKQNPEFDSGATRGYVYFIDTDGNQTVRKAQIQAIENGTIPIRDGDYNFYVGEPKQSVHCVNKGYVDGKFVAKDTVSSNGLYGKSGGVDILYHVSQWGVGGEDAIARRTNKGGLRVVLDETNAKTEEMATPRGYVDGKINALSQDISVINIALEQSGLLKKYKQPIEQEYNERVTADGFNVLDGSSAVLKKVVGSTVACKNLVDIPFIDGTTGEQEFAVNFAQNIFITVGELATVSASVWRIRYTYADGTFYYTMDNHLIANGMLVPATSDNPIVGITYRGDAITAGQYSKIMIAYGDTATEYQPYFTGLKSASFGGIESTNADGTETSTFAFPKTEMPLGKTIDFESGKITEYGVDLVLNGGERISYYSSTSIDGSIVFGGLGGDEVNPIGVCTDGELSDSQEYGKFRINFGSIYWYGILDKLGYTNDSNGVNQFKAYLSQRYTDGNPVTIRYVSSALQSETDFSAEQSASGNEYTAYKGGTEKVLDNDGKDYGAENTLSQNYIIVTEVK